ncbi:MAG: ATP-binding protein [Micropruina sp.]|uniref:sensor histidine kinase n=1 Tax=Micropruina sp. TaxID=2737536 RepID=UPI0039E21FD1
MKALLPTRAYAAVCTAGLLFGVLFAVLIATTPSIGCRSKITTVSLMSYGAFAAFFALRRGLGLTGRRRGAWLFIAVGLCFGVLANSVDLLSDRGALLINGVDTVDLILMVSLLICLVGLTLFPPSRRRGTDLTRLMMDGLVVGGSVMFIASATLFPTLLAGRDSSLSSQAQILALPVLDLVMATLAILLIARSGTSSRVPLLLVGMALLLYSVSDMAYAVNMSRGTVALGSWWDMGWLGGYVCAMLAALHPDSGRPQQGEAPESSSLPSTIVFFTIFLIAAAANMTVYSTGGQSLASSILWGVLILVVVVRQIVLVMDNEQLRRSLEVRVLERTEELLEITTQRELLLASVADGIYGVDQDGRVTMVNRATTKLLGRAEHELVGANAHDLFHAPQSDGTPFPIEGCYITEATKSGLTASGEDDIYVRGDGSTIVVEATASPIKRDSRISGAVVVFRDVSQRREMDRMKQEFISFISHELRTPLTSIRGALGLISGGAFGALPPKAAQMIDIATSGSVRLGRLVNDILEIERLDSGMLPLNIRTHDVAVACQEAIVATSGMAQAAGIALRLGSASGRVQADRDRLVQVLINLVGNAVRFSDPGDSVQLSATRRGELIEFAVSDTGRGIPADKLETIFGRFSQVDSSDTREKGGTGLGLAICQGLIDRMDGRIWVESTLGKGSTFRFELPAGSADGAQQSAIAPVTTAAVAG